MARFDFLKPAEMKNKIANLAILKSKAFRVAVAVCVFCFAMGSGLSFLVVRTAQNEQLVELGKTSDRASQTLRDRIVALDSDVREATKRVELATTEATALAATERRRDVASGVAAEDAAKAGAQTIGTAPLEALWRERLEGSITELAKSRDDILDITYLGRFTAIPNGALTVVRVERRPDGSFVTSQADPRADWEGEFLQRVLQSNHDVAMISAPLIVGANEKSKSAVIRGADPVMGEDDAVVGVVMISVGLSSVLSNMQAELPDGTSPLLVTDAGVALLHPVPELVLSEAEDGTNLIRRQYPGLLHSVKPNMGAMSHSFRSEEFAARLLRFKVGGDASDLRFSLVVSAPPAHVDFATASQAALSLGAGIVTFNSPIWLVAGGVGALLLGAAGFVLVRRKRAAANAVEQKASTLSERASEIEAEQDEECAGEETPAVEHDADEIAAESEEATETESDQLEDETLAANAATDDEPGELEAAAATSEDEELIGEQPEEPSDKPSADEDPTTDPNEVEVPASISAESLVSARELQLARTRLEDELEEARRRSLDELAAARERFESELARERDLAITRLIAESRKAIALRTDEDFAPTRNASLPSVPSIEEAEFDLREMLVEVVAWMEGETFGRDQTFEVRCNRNVPNQLLGDPDWVGPLLVNLGKTAIDASDGAPVSLSVSCVDDGIAGVRVAFELVAKDTGFGADGSGKIHARRPGGLAMTQDLVEAMRGELCLENLPGMGSTLRVVLPMSLPS